MKLNDEEIEMFNSLNNSNLGNKLVSYLLRLQGYLCDCRQWSNKATAENAVMASNAIQDHLIDRIKNRNLEEEAEDME